MGVFSWKWHAALSLSLFGLQLLIMATSGSVIQHANVVVLAYSETQGLLEVVTILFSSGFL